MTFILQDLPYAYDALAPYMSAETLEYHHDKHHQAYITNGEKLAKEQGLEDLPLDAMILKAHGTHAGLFNNIAQHYNHTHFWKWMTPHGGGSKMPGAFADHLARDIGDFETFRTQFIQAGVSQFGSGWCWLVLKDGKMDIMQTPNGENPLIHGAVPLLGCDVWEHSYYIDYRNARPKYLEAFVDHLINWEYVEQLYEIAAQ